MNSFEITISPEAQACIKRLRTPPTQVIIQSLDRQNELTVGHIQLTRLSRKGPETLGVVTNRLRSSLRPRKATYEGSEIVSGIGSNVAYMGVHEFGFTGSVTVPAHIRRNPRGDRFRTSNGVVTRGQAAKSPPAKGKFKKVASGIAKVSAHTRRMNMPARAPIQRGIRERIPAYSAALSQAITDALKGQS